MFVVAGLLMLVATINEGLLWATEMETPELLQFAGFVGMILSYVGLVGLYPRLGGRRSRLAQAGIGLLFVPVAVVVIDLISVALGYGPPFGVTLATAAFGLFALGVALFGVISIRSDVYSSAVGVFLLVYTVAWFVLIGGGQLYGFPPSGEVVVTASGLMAVALLAVGYLLRTETEPTTRAEPASDSTA